MTDSQENKQIQIPTVMKAAQQNQYGNVREVLKLVENVEVPRKLSPKEILVKVHAASINPVNWKLLNGNLSLVKRLSFPHIPGSDVAGVVVDLGSSVTRFRLGDQVYGDLGIDGGTYAQYVRADQSLFAIKPNNLSMEQAAAVPLACLTSYQALFRKSTPPVAQGSKVFVCGGSTATGFFAIQLAKSVGAFVATTSSPRNFTLLQKLGYKLVHSKAELTNDENELLVIDYTNKQFGDELRGEDFHLVYDCVGGIEQWNEAQKILRRSGQFITIVGDDPKSEVTLKAMLSTGSGLIARKFMSVFGSSHHNYILHFLTENFEDLDELRTRFIETGKVKPLIDSIYDWNKDGAEALYSMYETSKTGKAQGKLILKIADA